MTDIPTPSGSGSSQCSLCDTTCERSRELELHLASHIDDGLPFECPDCADLFQSLQKYLEHLRAVHQEHIFEEYISDDEPSMVICEDNSETDDDKLTGNSDSHISLGSLLPSDDTTHLAQPKRKPVSVKWQLSDNKVRDFKCKQCKRSFTTLATLRLHIHRTHLNIRHHQCPECHWQFAQSGDLRKHMRKHRHDKPYKCELCNHCFKHKRNVGSHMKSHTETPTRCRHCQRLFFSPDSLKRHLKQHEGDAAKPCHVCSIPFTSDVLMNAHTKKTHGISMAPKKPYTCETCAKGFKLKSLLKKHQVIHSGKLPTLF